MSKSNVVRLPHVPSLTWDDCRLLVESVVDYAIFMLDAAGHVATWNSGAESIKGYKPSEIIGEHFSRFYPAEDVQNGKPERALKVATEVGRFEDEGWRIRKDGTRFWASVVITALRDESGQLRGFGKVTRDLTIRKAAEEQLRLAEERFHHLVDAVIDYAIFMLDPDGRVATWNPGARRVKGYLADEIVGKHFSVFYTPEDQVAGKPARILETVLRDGRFEDEGWRVRKDGTLFWANVVITSLRDDRSNLLGFAKVTRDLTDRRHAEEDLRRSEERFRLLLENVGDYAIYMLDLQGRVTTWNLGAERMKGYSAGEIIGQSFAAFFPASDVEAGKPERELAVARAQGRFEDEGWRIRKDGSRFWANALLTALRDARGELIGFAKITRDLTAQRQAEETERHLVREQASREAAERAEGRLRESEQRYRALSKRLEIVLEGVADGITVQDRSGRVVFANSAAARLCGMPSGTDLVNTPLTDVVAQFEMFDPENTPLTLDDLPARRVLNGEPGASAVIHVFERKTNRDWWALVRANAVLDSEGKPELAINIWHDVTAERRQELQSRYLAEASAALGSSLAHEEMLGALARVLVPSLADWCSIYVLEGSLLRNLAVANSDPRNASATSEYRRWLLPDSQQAGIVRDVVRTGSSAVLNETTDDALRTAGVRSALVVPVRVRDRLLGAIALVSSDPKRRFDSGVVTLLEELGRRSGVALENAQLYASAQAAVKEAEEASRAKDEFLATVSHELRTPLNAIVGWSSMLNDRALEASIAKPIDAIHRNAQAQVKIVDDILDVSRVITGKFRLDARAADLVAIARDAIEVVRPSAVAKRIAIDFAPETTSCLLVADADRLQQVIWNLLSNAVKFTDGGGSISVSVRRESSRLVVVVRDTGRGIDPSFLPHVFERFKQADSTFTRRFGGLGLGLALVRHIVELHGGQVAVASPGLRRGTTFTITLPVRAVSPSAAEPARHPADIPISPPVVSLAGVRVLVVDDEPDARDLLEVVLGSAGAEVETAESAAEGFAAFKRFRPDVLVSDIGMPDEDGFSFIKRVRALPSSEGGRTPSLALTAFAREEDRTRALSAGFTTHIGKPVNPGALAAAVANLSLLTPRN